MAKIKIRKTVVTLEEIRHDGGPELAVPRRRAAAAAVIANPFAGKFHAEIADFMEDLKSLGAQMTESLIGALGGDAAAIDGYGKGAIVGEAGELEHCALWHVPGGYAMREQLGDSMAIVPSSKKAGGMGARLDIPLGHINAAYVRSHFDAIEVGVSDAPRSHEIVYILAMACGPRVHARVGGLEAKDVKGLDGLR